MTVELAWTRTGTKMWSVEKKRKKKETFRETGLGILGWDMKMGDGLVGLYDWI